MDPTHEADFTFDELVLDTGVVLRPVTLHYASYGAMNENGDNVILVCHALSGSARVGDWWADLLGPGKPFDPSRHCVLGINVIGSCYGSTGPTSANPPATTAGSPRPGVDTCRGNSPASAARACPVAWRCPRGTSSP